NATAADLLTAIDQIAGPGNGAAFSTFLNQVGFPLVKVKLLCLAESMGGASAYQTELHLEQERFLPAGSQGSSSAIWGVPVCLRWKDSGKMHSKCILLSKPSVDLQLEGHACPTSFF